MPSSALPARILAWVLLALIFWLDSVTPLGVGDPVLYVAAVLLFIPAGLWWEPLLVAVAASLLTAAGLFIAHADDSWTLARWNRPIALAVIWITAGLVAQHRRNTMRWTVQANEHRQAREQSHNRLEEIRYALDQAAIVATTDQRGVITYVNDKFCEISKYSREELLGQDHRIVNSGHHPKEFIRDLWRTIARGQIWRGELRNRAKDGTIYWVDTTIVPFANAEGKPRQYLAIRSDITPRKIAEAQLVDQAALAQLGQLAAVVAHEVRNPLAGVRGTLQVLQGRLPNGHADRSIMEAMIDRLDGLNDKVTDMLRFARPRTPALAPLDLRPVIEDVLQSARASVGAGCPEIVVHGRAALALGDAEMVRAVLLNLLLNACQASVDATVEVGIGDAGNDVRITIADRGPGIDDQHLERVFEAFYTTKKSGTGLGLAIVKRLTDLQGGRVSLTRRDGGGMVAEVALPRAGAPISG